jgi:single-stranded DNA-binding protein
MTTNFAPSNSDSEVTVIVRASEDAKPNAEHEVTNFSFPVSRSWQSDSQDAQNGYAQQTAWFRAAAWKAAAGRAAEIRKGDIIIVNFSLADLSAKPYTKNDGTPGASLEIARCRARVIHAKGGESTYEGSVSQEPEPEAVAL